MHLRPRGHHLSVNCSCRAGSSLLGGSMTVMPLLDVTSCGAPRPEPPHDIVPLCGLHLFTILLSRAGKHPFLAQAADRAAFLDFALKMLLHQPPSLLVTESSANERTGITPFSRQFEEFVRLRVLTCCFGSTMSCQTCMSKQCTCSAFEISSRECSEPGS